MYKIFKFSWVSHASSARHFHKLFVNPMYTAVSCKRNRMLSVFLILTLNTFFISKTFSQNFDYSVITQNASFAFLSDSVQTITDSTVWDDNTFQIPIGFTFTFAGQTFDSLKIRTNGTLTFDKDNKYNFVALFKNFICDINSNNRSLSPIAKELTTVSDGSKRLKVEFQNATFTISSGTKVHVNFQIWLNQQNNSIEFHMGAIDSGVIGESCLLGLLNMNNNDGSSLGYLLEGDPLSPLGTVVPSQGSLVKVTNIPSAGSVYIFTKN